METIVLIRGSKSELRSWEGKEVGRYAVKKIMKKSYRLYGLIEWGELARNPLAAPHQTWLMRCYVRGLSGLTAAAAAAAAATNAAIAEAMKAKKIKLEVMSSYHSGSGQHGADPENGDLSSSAGESPQARQTYTKPFLVTNGWHLMMTT